MIEQLKIGLAEYDRILPLIQSQTSASCACWGDY